MLLEFSERAYLRAIRIVFVAKRVRSSGDLAEGIPMLYAAANLHIGPCILAEVVVVRDLIAERMGVPDVLAEVIVVRGMIVECAGMSGEVAGRIKVVNGLAVLILMARHMTKTVEGVHMACCIQVVACCIHVARVRKIRIQEIMGKEVENHGSTPRQRMLKGEGLVRGSGEGSGALRRRPFWL